jgi:hypothetical protein
LTKFPDKLHDEYKSGSSKSNTGDEEEWQHFNDFGGLRTIFGIINTMNIKSKFEH